MINLEVLIDDCSNNKITVTDLLLKSKVLASKLKIDEFKTWINSELHGYVEDVPEYRKVRANIIGHIDLGFKGQLKNYPIPIANLSQDFKDTFQNISIKNSISSLDNESGKLSIKIPPEFFHYMSSNINGEVLYAQADISSTQVKNILTSVKSKILDFLLTLEEKFGNEMNEKTAREEANLNKLFNDTVFGNNATINIAFGNNNSQQIEIVIENDFEALEAFLKANNVATSDIQELKEIIKIDNVDIKKKTFGEKTKLWMSKMYSKALDGTWQIALGAAGSILAEGISKYYGFQP